MTLEDQHTDRKSLRTVTGKTADWDALAKDCVCFANGAGGRLLIGMEDGEALPPAGQVRALILEDLARYPESSSGDINRRIGVEISARTVKRALDELSGTAEVAYVGERRWRRYRLSGALSNGQKGGEFS